MNGQNVDRKIAPLYMAVMLEIERRRLQLKISMQEVCDRSGVADYYYSKALHASTPSGREARWSTLQDIVDALYPEGYDVEIRPKVGLRLDAAQLRCKIKFAASAAVANPKLQRELMRDLGRLGGSGRQNISRCRRRNARQSSTRLARRNAKTG